jgi:hypothetical protein
MEEKKQAIEEVQRLTVNLAELENRNKDKAEHLLRAEKDRKDMLLYEEEMRLARRLKAEQEYRDRRL